MVRQGKRTASTNAPNFRFLCLPREIRDSIYALVLEHELSPPLQAQVIASSRIATSSDGMNRKQAVGNEKHVHYPQGRLPLGGAGLLRANRQIRAEMQAAVQRLKSQDAINYRLDCLIDGGRRLLPTWLKVPALCERLNVVRVDFRLSGACEKGLRSTFQAGHNGPKSVNWDLLALLTRFLTKGPIFVSPRQGVPEPARVNVLDVNVISPPRPGKGFKPGFGHTEMRSDWYGYVVDPRFITCVFRDALISLLEGRCDAVPGTKETVRRKVRYIVISLDDVKRYSWDLTAGDKASASPTEHV